MSLFLLLPFLLGLLHLPPSAAATAAELDKRLPSRRKSNPLMEDKGPFSGAIRNITRNTSDESAEGSTSFGSVAKGLMSSMKGRR